MTPIESDRFYHIYNRGINGETIFKTERNYLFFLKKLKENLVPVCEIYAYCLMPNHFHLLVKIKSDQELLHFANSQKIKINFSNEGLHSNNFIFSKQFSKIFNSYSQAFNKENNRHGSLIESPFKRKIISSEKYLRDCIIYIHQNPKQNDFTQYKFSSYESMTVQKKTLLSRDEVINLFDHVANFVFCHNKEVDYQF